GAGLARQAVRHNVTINNILPGQFMTDRLKTRLTVNAKEAGITLEQYLAKRSQVIPAGRFGDPNEFGELCAYVCSVQAAFITGQNFLIDGGTYPGTYCGRVQAGRGANMMMAMPAMVTAPPVRSQTVGRMPSTAHSQTRAVAT